MLLDSRLYSLLAGENRLRVVASACAAALPFLLARAYCRSRRDDTTHQLPLALPGKCHLLAGHVGELQHGLQHMFDLFVASAIDGVTRFYLPMFEQTISVTRAEHVMEVLNASTSRNYIPIMGKHFQMFAGYNTLALAENRLWRLLRKIFGKIFQVVQLRAMVGAVNESAAEFVETLSSKHGETVELCDMFRLVSVDILGKVVFGHDFGCSKSLEPPEYVSSFHFMIQSFHDRIVNAVDPRYYFYWWPSEHNRRFLKERDKVRSFVNEIIKAKRATPLSNRETDVLQMMIDASEEESTALSDEVFTDNMISLLFAGFDTTAISLANAMLALAHHPKVEAKAVEEVLRVLGQEGLPTYEHLSSGLPYCTAVIKEALRLWPSIPSTTRHLETPLQLTLRRDRTSTDDEPMIVTIPAGHHMWVPIWWVHRDPANFENPLAFDPERFFDPARAAKIHKYAYVPFSGGVRDCPGRKFAMLEAVAVFAVLVRKLKFEAVPGYKPHYVLRSLVAEPEGGIPMKVLARARLPAL